MEESLGMQTHNHLVHVNSMVSQSHCSSNLLKLNELGLQHFLLFKGVIVDVKIQLEES